MSDQAQQPIVTLAPPNPTEEEAQAFVEALTTGMNFAPAYDAHRDLLEHPPEQPA